MIGRHERQVLIKHGSNYVKIHRNNFQLRSDSNIIRPINLIDSQISEYKIGPIQSKDHNAWATDRESREMKDQNLQHLIFENENIENKHE